MATKKVPKKKRVTDTKITVPGAALTLSKKEPEIVPVPATGVYATHELLRGNYCNVGVFKHTAREFVFDFIWAVDNQGSLVSRVITSPEHAKALYEVLGKNIEQYEKTYGKIGVGE